MGSSAVSEHISVLVLDDRMTGPMGKAVAGIDKKLNPALGRASKRLVSFGLLGATAILGIGITSLKVAADVDRMSRRIAVSLGRPIEEAEKFRKVIRDVYANSAVASFQEAGAAVQAVAEQLVSLGITSTEEIGKVTKNAIALAKTFNLDVSDSTEAAAALMDNFGLSADQAFDFVASGLQKGLNRSDDFLDSISEYSVQFKNADADAGQFFSFLESGLQTGVLGTDKAADVFKEFRLRLLEDSDAMRESISLLLQGAPEAFEDYGRTAEEVMANIRSGNLGVADTFEAVIEALRGVSDPVERMQLGVALLGTQFQDLGDDAVLGLDLSATSMEDLEGKMEDLGEQFKDLEGFMLFLRKAGGLALDEIGAAMLPLIKERIPEMKEGFAKLAELAPKIGELFAAGLDFAINTLVPFVTKVVEFTAANRNLIIPLLKVVGIFIFFSRVIIPVATTLKLVVGSMRAIGTVAPLAAAGLTKMGTASTIATGAQGAGGLLGLKAAAGAAGVGTAGAIGAVAVAAGTAAVAVGAVVLESALLTQSFIRLVGSNEAAEVKLNEYVSGLEAAGIQIDRTRLQNLNFNDAIQEVSRQVDVQKNAQRDANVEIVKAEVAARKAGQTTTAMAEAEELQAQKARAATTSIGFYKGALDILEGSSFDNVRATGTLADQVARLTRLLNEAKDAALNLASVQGGGFAGGGVVPFKGGGIVPFAKGGMVPKLSGLIGAPAAPVQKLARGGKALPTFALVGEQGPELRSDLGGSHITPASATERIFGAVADRLTSMMREIPRGIGKRDIGPGAAATGSKGQPPSRSLTVHIDLRGAVVDNDERLDELVERFDEKIQERFTSAFATLAL